MATKRNEVLVQVREFIRQPYAWPGGYPKYLVMADGGCLCKACAKSEYKQISQDTRQRELWSGWVASGVDINYENPDLYCDHCSQQIESASGEPVDE